MREIVTLAARLLIITLVSGALLATANAITEEPILMQEMATAERLRLEVFPDADAFESIDLEEDAPVDSAYAAIVDGAAAGMVIETTAKGFGGSIVVTVGIDIGSGIITGVRIGSHSETAGLGDKAAKEPFYGQFTGKSLEPLDVSKTAGDERRIQAISAATITSKAVTDAVNEAVTYAKTLDPMIEGR